MMAATHSRASKSDTGRDIANSYHETLLVSRSNVKANFFLSLTFGRGRLSKLVAQVHFRATKYIALFASQRQNARHCLRALKTTRKISVLFSKEINNIKPLRKYNFLATTYYKFFPRPPLRHVRLTLNKCI
jgi:hypothetical protein